MSDNDMVKFRQTIRGNGHRLTNAREATFRLLVSPEPLAISEILSKAKNVNIDRVSVYRNIELFEKLGIVHRIYVGWKYKLELSDDFIDHHHHMSCLDCGKIFDFGDEKHLDAFINATAAKVGFTPRRHQFEVDGYCKDCSKEN